MIEIYEKQGGRLVYCGSGAEPVKFRDEQGAFRPEVGAVIGYCCWPDKLPGCDPPWQRGRVMDIRWDLRGGPTTATVAVIVTQLTGIAAVEGDEP